MTFMCGKLEINERFVNNKVNWPHLGKGRCQSKIDGEVVPCPMRRRHHTSSLFTLTYNPLCGMSGTPFPTGLCKPQEILRLCLRMTGCF